jgi:hypothetical protein
MSVEPVEQVKPGTGMPVPGLTCSTGSTDMKNLPR